MTVSTLLRRFEGSDVAMTVYGPPAATAVVERLASQGIDAIWRKLPTGHQDAFVVIRRDGAFARQSRSPRCRRSCVRRRSVPTTADRLTVTRVDSCSTRRSRTRSSHRSRRHVAWTDSRVRGQGLPRQERTLERTSSRRSSRFARGASPRLGRRHPRERTADWEPPTLPESRSTHSQTPPRPGAVAGVRRRRTTEQVCTRRLRILLTGRPAPPDDSPRLVDEVMAAVVAVEE